MDLNVEHPNTETPKWSETRFFGAYDPETDVGIYVHAGRFRKDLELWWVHLCAYLPDGSLVVDRSWGRPDDRRTVRTGPFLLRQEDDGFHTTFDGVGERTTTAALARAPRGAGAGLSRLRWDVRFTDLTPMWDMYGADATKHEFAGDSHSQRSFTTAGSVTVDGTEYALDGVGWRDHSSGVRAWDGYGYHHFVLAVFPDCSFHAIMIHGPNGEPKGPLGGFYHRDGTETGIAVSVMDPMADAECGPRAGDFTVQPAGGEPMTLHYEILHQLPIIINDDGDNMNGIDWDADVLSLVLGEAICRLTRPDGVVGYGFHERGTKRPTLVRPT